MTTGLLFFAVLTFFVSEVVCEREIILQSRFRVAGVVLVGFLAVWVFAELLSNQPLLSPILDTLRKFSWEPDRSLLNRAGWIKKNFTSGVLVYCVPSMTTMSHPKASCVSVTTGRSATHTKTGGITEIPAMAGFLAVGSCGSIVRPMSMSFCVILRSLAPTPP